MTTLRYGRLELPKEVKVSNEDSGGTFARFTVEPFVRGFGHTIGNSLRRTMLSVIESPAIISVSIEGVLHEYMSIKGVVEDMTHIILNLKGALLKRELVSDDVPREDIFSKTFEVTQDMLDHHGGQVRVLLNDLFADSPFQVINPEHYICSVTSPIRKQITFRVAVNSGYVPSEGHMIKNPEENEIFMDANFSPVTLVNYSVKMARVGENIGYDCIVLEITTDGRISPKDALKFSADILKENLEVFSPVSGSELSFESEVEIKNEEKSKTRQKLALYVREIELPVRADNCLKDAGIESIAELVIIPEHKMLEFRNFGKKSLNEIKKVLIDMGLRFGMNLEEYGIHNTEEAKSFVRDVRAEGNSDLFGV